MRYSIELSLNSISIVYCTQLQIVTRVNAAHSLFCFVIAKLSKISGFCKVFARKKCTVNSPLKSFSHLVISQNGCCCSCCSCCSKFYRENEPKTAFCCPTCPRVSLLWDSGTVWDTYSFRLHSKTRILSYLCALKVTI